MTEAEQRAAVVAEAMTWLETPYHHEARSKGAGVDCAQLLAGVYINVGLIAPFAVNRYPPDWHLNSPRERLLEVVGRFAQEIEGPPRPGDVVLWRFHRCFAHGAIVVEWPVVIHSCKPRKVMKEDVERAGWLTKTFEMQSERGRPRPRKFFSYWAAR